MVLSKHKVEFLYSVYTINCMKELEKDNLTKSIHNKLYERIRERQSNKNKKRLFGVLYF